MELKVKVRETDTLVDITTSCTPLTKSALIPAAYMYTHLSSSAFRLWAWIQTKGYLAKFIDFFSNSYPR